MSTVYEVPSGIVNGSNTAFVSSQPYTAGTLHLFLNGQLKRSDYDDGLIETDPTSGTFALKEAPRNGDVVQVYYVEATGAGASASATSVQVIGASISEPSAGVLEGELKDLISLGASTSTNFDISGSLGDSKALRGAVAYSDLIGGSVVTYDRSL